MFLRTDDPIADYDRWDAEQERELERLPVCTECGERITDDFFYDINGECICERCMDANYKKSTDDYIE